MALRLMFSGFVARIKGILQCDIFAEQWVQRSHAAIEAFNFYAGGIHKLPNNALSIMYLPNSSEVVAVQWRPDEAGHLCRVADVNASGNVVSVVCVGTKRTGPLVSKFGKKDPLDFVGAYGAQFVVPSTEHYMLRDKRSGKHDIHNPLRQEILLLMNMWSEAAFANGMPQADHDLANRLGTMCQFCNNVGDVGLGSFVYCPICLIDCHSVCLSIVNEHLETPAGHRFISRLPSMNSGFQLPNVFDGR